MKEYYTPKTKELLLKGEDLTINEVAHLLKREVQHEDIRKAMKVNDKELNELIKKVYKKPKDKRANNRHPMTFDPNPKVIDDMIIGGMTARKIAIYFGVSPGTVGNFIYRSDYFNKYPVKKAAAIYKYVQKMRREQQ